MGRQREGWTFDGGGWAVSEKDEGRKDGSERFAEETEDVRRVVGVEPGDGGVAAEPGLLLAGVDAGVTLDAGYGLVERELAVEMLKKLFVTDRVEGVEVALGVEGASLAEEAVGHHLVDAGVDAAEELFAWADEPDLEDAEGAHFDGTRAEVGVGAAGGAADLDGVDDTARIAAVDFSEVHGVGLSELVEQGVESEALIVRQDGSADVGGYGGDVVDALADGVDVHHRSAGEEDGRVGREKGRKEGQSVRFIACGAVRFGGVEEVDEVVRDAGAFVGRGGGGADGHAAIDLSGVGREDGAAEVFGQPQTERRLAHAGGAEQDEEGGERRCCQWVKWGGYPVREGVRDAGQVGRVPVEAAQ